jgi:hypothetical protein
MKQRNRFVPALLSALLAIAFAASFDSASADIKTTTSVVRPGTKPAPEAKEAPRPGTVTVSEAGTATTPPSREEIMAAMMKAIAPGSEHAALNPLAGTWKTTVKMWEGVGEPTVTEGICERNWTMGGRYLVGNYKGVFNGMKFEGMEVLGYDNVKKQYVSSWMDTMGTGIMTSTGGPMDPSTKSFTLTGPATDPLLGNFTMREVTSIVDSNTYVMTCYGNPGGAQEAKMMEITYTRAK